MSRDDIIRMAQEACDTDKVDAWHNGFWTLTQEEIERFASLVIQEDREKLAKAIQGLPFGDTASSFARFVREFKPSP